MVRVPVTIGALIATAAALPRSVQQTAACSPLELVIARGTTEPIAPDFGVIVGDPLFNATKTLIPEVTGYMVDYPASFEAPSRNLGRDDVVKHMDMQSKACPNQKYVLVGYSQGGDVMHSAAAMLNPALFDRIVALTLFGDPGNKGLQAKSPLNCDIVPPIPAGLAQKLKENCEKGDPVCTNDGTELEAHLVYVNEDKGYIKASSEYILKQYQTNGKAGPSPSPNVGTGDNTAALANLGVMLGAPADSPKGQCGFAPP